MKQTRREKGRVTRKRLQDTPSRIPPQTPIPALLISSSEQKIFPPFSFPTIRPGVTMNHHDHHDVEPGPERVYLSLLCMALSSLPPLTRLTWEFLFTSPGAPEPPELGLTPDKSALD